MALTSEAPTFSLEAEAARVAWTQTGDPFGEVDLGGFRAETRASESCLWIVLRSPNGGGLAIRGSHLPGGRLRVRAETRTRFVAVSDAGRFETVVRGEKGVLRVTVSITPKAPLSISHLPRDVFPFTSEGRSAEGEVLAAQRGCNGGMLYARVDAPQSDLESGLGAFLYVQNFTALNPYFSAIDRAPDGAVGGIWPELGYMPPTDAARALSAGETFVLSDAIVVPSATQPFSQTEQGRLFLDLMHRAYPHLDRPEPEYRDWPALAAESLHGIGNSVRATETSKGGLYARPYLDGERPDSMSQLAVCTPMAEWEREQGKAIPKVIRELREATTQFYDPALGILRRNLKIDAKGKEADVVDAWYLFHPLMNLARWAQAGDEEARTQFVSALPYIQKAARHFRYDFPIKFHLSNFAVVTEERKPGEPGQSDLGGVYAYIMLVAEEITGDPQYGKEAGQALRISPGAAFEGFYQANLTAWGIAAAVRLWLNSREDVYLDMSLLSLATFVHNSVLWDSDLRLARHYSTFFGATCLHDAPYMAAYECFESAGAFTEALDRASGRLPESATRLMSEFVRYALSRAWSFYPQNLPGDAISSEVKNGVIDKRLAFPLEDLHADGSPAGQVGQEVYGAGAAAAYARLSHRRIEGAPFTVWSEIPLAEIIAIGSRRVQIQAHGVPQTPVRLRVLPREGKMVRPLLEAKGVAMTWKKTPEGHFQTTISAGERLELCW